MFKVYKGKYQSFQYNNIICNLKYKFVIVIVIQLYLEAKYDFGYLHFLSLGFLRFYTTKPLDQNWRCGISFSELNINFTTEGLTGH